MKTVLLTGATGFLGSHIAKALLDNNFKVLAYCREQSDFSRLESVKSDITWFKIGDGLDAPFKAAKIDHIIQTATNYGRSQEQSTLLVETNLSFPLKLFELAELYSINTFFNTDTVLHKYVNAYALSKKQLCEW
ncbi:MAG: NAD-dependent epimerase/dehydratase family protein, partial [Methylococcaceae bacterium]|nr:NAD-dependent epimerase/dehydratase family protein [Methylococcaceae bacterium]